MNDFHGDFTNPTAVERVDFSSAVSSIDHLAVEEPLEIRLGSASQPHRSLSITMRTPGADKELALGFLFTEGILTSAEQVERVFSCGTSGNVLRVELTNGEEVDWQKLQRHFYTTSSCGVCGKSSIEALESASPFTISKNAILKASVIHELPNKLRQAQPQFEITGGLHGAGLFDLQGNLIDVQEDVGRHNAVDKVIGNAFLNKQLPLHRSVLVLSGRASFELIQKAKMAAIPFVISVGAPSSLAVQLAEQSGITLVGFVRDQRFNVYSIKEKIRTPHPQADAESC